MTSKVSELLPLREKLSVVARSRGYRTLPSVNGNLWQIPNESLKCLSSVTHSVAYPACELWAKSALLLSGMVVSPTGYSAVHPASMYLILA
jgi:hypothetical protein